MKKRKSLTSRSAQMGLAWLIVLLLVCGTGFFTLHPAAAAPAPAPVSDSPAAVGCFPLSVVFVVDQSQSMGGLDNKSGNDPAQQRKYAVEAAIDTLTDQSTDKCPGVLELVGVVSFGDQVRVDLPMSIIQPQNFQVGQTLRSDLKKNLAADNLGTTNTAAAIQTAFQMLDDARKTMTADQLRNRKQIIVLVTDGFPCLESDSDTCDYYLNSLNLKSTADQLTSRYNGQAFDPTLNKLEKCMQGLYEKYNDWSIDGTIAKIPDDEVYNCRKQYLPGDTAYQKSTYIWTLFLQSKEVPPARVLDLFKAMTSEHGGQTVLLSGNPADTSIKIRQILAMSAWVKDYPICGNFAVNPYLRRIIVNAYGNVPDPQIQLSYTDANGVDHTIVNGQASASGGFNVVEHYTFGVNERYVFDYPYPGIWGLKVGQGTCDSMNIYYDPVNIDTTSSPLNVPLNVPQHDLPPYYDPDPGYQYRLEYAMKDSTGTILPEADASIFKVNFTTTVTRSNSDPASLANPQVLGMAWNATDQVFRSSDPIQLPSPGTYTVSMQGTTHVHTGEPALAANQTNLDEVFDTESTLFQYDNLKFTVDTVSPWVIAPAAPQNQKVYVSVHASIVKGWPLKLQPFTVRVRAMDRSGKNAMNPSDIFTDPNNALVAYIKGVPSTKVTLLPVPGSKGEFTGQITGIDTPGAKTLVIETVSNSVLKSPYVPDSHHVEVNFFLGDPFWATAGFYYGLLGLAILGVVTGISYNIAIRTNKVSGTIYFKDAGTTIAEFGLYNGTNFHKFGPKELQPYPQLMLKSVKVQNAGKKKKAARRGAEDAVTGDMFSDLNGPMGVQVSLVTTSGRKFTMNLEPDLPATYGDETFAQIMYEPVR